MMFSIQKIIIEKKFAAYEKYFENVNGSNIKQNRFIMGGCRTISPNLSDLCLSIS